MSRAWSVAHALDTVRLREPVSSRVPLQFTARPMLGCIGVAAPGDFAPTSAPSGNYGGNLDYNEIGEGATVVLPVFHPGALLFLGDGHALMADGEPTGTGVETSMDVEFSVELKKNAAVTGPRGPNELSVSVSYGGKQYPAVFRVRAKDAARKEVAAYRLDRQLGLGLVPVAVEREVQGQRGVLQGRPLKWVTQADVQQQSLHGGGWCSTEPQFQLVYAFDTLIGNEGRTPESLLFDSESWFVYVTSHEHAFGTTQGLPAYLKSRPPTPGAEIRRRLAALDEASLQAALGDLVDGKARKAILERRDALLALPAAAATTTSP